MKFNLCVLEGKFCIYQFTPDTKIPEVLLNTDFHSITRSMTETSVISRTFALSNQVQALNANWKVLKVEPFQNECLHLLMADIIRILKEKNINFLTISTFEAEYVLIKLHFLETAMALFDHYQSDSPFASVG